MLAGWSIPWNVRCGDIQKKRHITESHDKKYHPFFWSRTAPPFTGCSISPSRPLHQVRSAAARSSPRRRKWRRRMRRCQRSPGRTPRWGWTSTWRVRFGQAAWDLKGYQKTSHWTHDLGNLQQFGQCNGEIHEFHSDNGISTLVPLENWLKPCISLPNIEASVGFPFQFWDWYHQQFAETANVISEVNSPFLPSKIPGFRSLLPELLPSQISGLKLTMFIHFRLRSKKQTKKIMLVGG